MLLPKTNTTVCKTQYYPDTGVLRDFGWTRQEGRYPAGVLKENLAGGRISGKTARRGKGTSDMQNSIGKSMEVGKCTLSLVKRSFANLQ